MDLTDGFGQGEWGVSARNRLRQGDNEVNPENRIRGYFEQLTEQVATVLEDQQETMHEIAHT